MEPKKLSSLIVLCILVTASRCQNITPRPKTDGCCLGRVARDIIALINYGNGTNETECTKQCINSDTCVGVDWRSNSGPHDNKCKLFITMNNVIQRSVVNCADDQLSYCWKVKAGVHQVGGKHDKNITNEADCKRICVDNTNCTVVVWNANKTECWILLHKHDTTTKTHRELVNHWTIVRDLPRTFQETTGNIEFMTELMTESYSSYNGSTTQKWTKEDAIIAVLATFLGVLTLIIIGISICSVKLNKCCSTQKGVDEAKVVDVAKVVKAKVNDYGEAKEDDDESYIDYQDLRRLENPPTTCEEEGCEYTAMELENMKEMEDDDNIYYNEDQ